MATIKHAPICLIIMDGWGIGDVTDKYNAIQVGNTPVLDELMEKYPNSRLQASQDIHEHCSAERRARQGNNERKLF